MSFTEPFALASYALPKKEHTPWTHATTPTPAPGRPDGLITVTAQGDGVHILDVAEIHPIIAHTLGAGTTFACAAASTVADGVCTTYVAIAAAPDLPAELAGRAVWAWASALAGGAPTGEKRVALVPAPVRAIHVLEDVHNKIAVVDDSGNVLVLPADLSALPDAPVVPAQDGTLLKSLALPLSGCTFAAVREGAAVMAFVLDEAGLAVRLAVVGRNGEVLVRETRVPGLTKDVADAAFSATGCCTVLDQSGALHLFQASLSPTSLSLTRPTPSLPLVRLSTLPHELTVTALTDSHFLLAARPSGTSDELALFLWDLRYATLLASHRLPLPAPLHSGALRISLASSTDSTAVLVLTPAPGTSASKGARAHIFAVPLAVPAVSTIAGAMGCAAETQAWIAQGSQLMAATTTMDVRQRKTLENMRAAVGQGRGEAADGAFFGWAEQNPGTQLDHTFARAVLNVVLQPDKSAGVSYSPKVVQHLLRQNAVSANMVEAGLLDVLEQRQDWASISLTLQHVKDLPESDIIARLHTVVQAHRSPSADGMDIDSASPVPPLPQFLAACVNCPVSPAALRLAVRQHLRAADDVLAVLAVLEQWTMRWSHKTAKLVGAPPPAKPKQPVDGGVPPAALPTPLESRADLPALDKILAFLHPLLDASFLALVQHPPAHGPLRRLARDVAPGLALLDELAPLRGPLEPFARAQARAARGPKKEAVKDGEWRRKRRAAHEMAQGAVGVYQLEELVI